MICQTLDMVEPWKPVKFKSLVSNKGGRPVDEEPVGPSVRKLPDKREQNSSVRVEGPL